MKTSFYFVLWILIYPILELFHISFIDNNSFMIALILGIVYIGLGITIMLSQSSLEAEAVAVMYILYGSLAGYFGI